MKEKLKNIFKNKGLWSTLVEILCAVLLVSVGYFSGFSTGLIIDNSIRTEIIEKTLDESKLNKKQLNNNFNTDDLIAIPYGSTISNYVFDVGLVFDSFYDYSTEWKEYALGNYTSTTYVPIFYSYTSYSDNSFSVNNTYYNFNVYQIGFGATGDIYFRVSSFKNLIKDNDYSYSGGAPSNLNYFYLNASTNSVVYSQLTGTTLLNFSMIYFTNTNSILQLGSFTYSFTNINAILYDLFEFGCFEISSGGATDEELEQAYQNGYDTGYQDGLDNGFTDEDIYNSYLNGFDKGKSEGKIEGYNEGVQVGYEIGYQDRKDSVEDTEDRINSIWTILENAISSVLNVLSFEILPGIPLYICVVVPVLLGLILWVVKMGGS